MPSQQKNAPTWRGLVYYECAAAKMMIFDCPWRCQVNIRRIRTPEPQYRGECEYELVRGAADRHDEAGRLGEQAQFSWVPSAPPAASAHRGGPRVRRRETSPALSHEVPPRRPRPAATVLLRFAQRRSFRPNSCAWLVGSTHTHHPLINPVKTRDDVRFERVAHM